MARDFNGTSDTCSLGSDSSIDDFTARTFAMWLDLDSDSSYGELGIKQGATTGYNGPFIISTTKLGLFQNFSVTDGEWESNAGIGTSLIHFVCTYDRSSTSNDPAFYKNNVSTGVTEVSTPSGSSNGDAGDTLGFAGTDGGLINGAIAYYCYDDEVWDAAMRNRHMWWGCAPGGPSTVKVWHPFWTSATANKGTATADASLSGSTMISAIPRVERMWGSLMGCGR